MIFTQKKTVPYRVAAATLFDQDVAALEILTSWQVQDLQLSDYSPSQRVSNGQYVVDVKKKWDTLACSAIGDCWDKIIFSAKIKTYIERGDIHMAKTLDFRT